MIRIIDTTIMLNILEVPGRSDDKQTVMAQLKEYKEIGDTLILPVATMVEAGNAIAQIHGNVRRKIAEKFAGMLMKTAKDEAPWSYAGFEIGTEELKYFAYHFTDYATRGIGLGDLSIVHTFEKCKNKMPSQEVMIWSLDTHLQGYKT